MKKTWLILITIMMIALAACSPADETSSEVGDGEVGRGRELGYRAPGFVR